jgi:SAM-dependent methyltransferase
MTPEKPMYDQIASDYDRFNNWQSRLDAELPFIETILSSAPKSFKVLDAACGTGMHAIALAKHGYKVSSADLSEAMIDVARANARHEGAGVRFEAAGFGSLASTFASGSFDAVLCLGNSLPHAASPEALTSALHDFANCLRAGGRLLIQSRNFDAVMVSRQRWMEPQAYSDAENEWLFMRFYDFEPDGLIRFNMVSLKRPRGGEWTSSVSSTMLMPQLQAGMLQTLAVAGFTSITSYGDMTGSPFDPVKSPNLVLLALKI